MTTETNRVAAPVDAPSVPRNPMENCRPFGLKYDLPPMVLSGSQLLEALEFVAPDRTADQMEQEVCIALRDEGQDADGAPAPRGTYCWLEEYPGEGSIMLEGRALAATPLPAMAGCGDAPLVGGVDVRKGIEYGFANYGYRQGTKECIAFNRGAQWLSSLATTPPTAPSGDVRKVLDVDALAQLVEMCEVHGDFSNGVTDPTGSIDEGNVRASEIIRAARAALANIPPAKGDSAALAPTPASQGDGSTSAQADQGASE